jgi:hypothetical protein
MWDNTQGTLARHLHSVGENDVHQNNRRQLRHLIVALYVCVAVTPNLAPLQRHPEVAKVAKRFFA